MKNPTDNTYFLVQMVLLSTALTCLLIAISTYLFGDDHLLQESPYPSLALIVLLSLGLWRWLSPKEDESETP